MNCETRPGSHCTGSTGRLQSLEHNWPDDPTHGSVCTWPQHYQSLGKRKCKTAVRPHCPHEIGQRGCGGTRASCWWGAAVQALWELGHTLPAVQPLHSQIHQDKCRHVHRETWARTSMAALWVITENCKHPKCLSTGKRTQKLVQLCQGTQLGSCLLKQSHRGGDRSAQLVRAWC